MKNADIFTRLAEKIFENIGIDRIGYIGSCGIVYAHELKSEKVNLSQKRNSLAP